MCSEKYNKHVIILEQLGGNFPRFALLLELLQPFICIPLDTLILGIIQELVMIRSIRLVRWSPVSRPIYCRIAWEQDVGNRFWLWVAKNGSISEYSRLWMCGLWHYRWLCGNGKPLAKSIVWPGVWIKGLNCASKSCVLGINYFIYIKHGKQVYNAWIRGANFGVNGGVCE